VIYITTKLKKKSVYRNYANPKKNKIILLNFIPLLTPECRGNDHRDVTVSVIIINYNAPRGRS